MTEQVKTTRPEYDIRAPQWKLMRDAVDGEDAVKSAGTTYLPMPSGFAKQEDKGAALYKAYQTRAQFPEITAPAVQAMVGVIHATEIQIDLPDSMGYLWESATPEGSSLESFHRCITGEILTTGRFGILAGAPSTGGDPYLTGYPTEAIINWSDDRDFYVLDESALARDGFTWHERPQYRVLELQEGVYSAKVYSGEALSETAEVQPKARGDSALNEIPFVAIGPRNLSATPETPPLIGVARAAIAMYQLSADYRWQLFMTGQETLFIFNADAPENVGAGVVIGLKSDMEGVSTDARYVGPDGTGIAAHRLAIQDEINNAATAGAKLFNRSTKSAESGDALRIRFAAETASLTTVAMASCAGLEKALRYVGRMKSLSDEEIEQIVVHPPRSFADKKLTPEEVKAIMGLVDDGLISMETAHEKLQAGDWASPERDWEDEARVIEQEREGRHSDTDPQALMTPNQPALQAGFFSSGEAG